jgi:glutaredoxin
MNKPTLLLFALLVCAALDARADIYKVVGPDGKISYTDKEPQTVGAKSEKLKIQTYSGAPSVSNSGTSVRKVTILSAEWCGICTRAKNYMKSRGIAFEEWDIDRSDFARAKMRELGARGVPVILAGGQKMVGFSEAGLDAMLKKSGGD